MKRKIIALLLCFVCVFSLCFPVAADDDGYSAIVSDIDKTCPTCGATLHASWGSTSGAEVELEISDTGKVKIPAGAGAFARIHLRCSSCGYEKTETRLLGLDFGAEKPGKLVEAPSGIGRKDLPGYADDNGTANYNSSGVLQVVVNPIGFHWDSSSYKGSKFGLSLPVSVDVSGSQFGLTSNPKWALYAIYEFVAPCDGIFYLGREACGQTVFTSSLFYNSSWYTQNYNIPNYDGYGLSVSASKGQTLYYVSDALVCSIDGYQRTGAIKAEAYPLIILCEPLSSLTKLTNITINNNTWNGNIYTDNSTNLTYIYPQYTTINEKNETVTNISNTPIIYNNETKQYYTYDQTTKNYYYITYNPDPAPSPTPTPAPTEKPGGSISTPETGKPGGSSGSSWWDKLLSKIGDAIIDGLLGAVSAVLKLIFKLLSTILSWIIWAVSRVFDLLPFLPPGLGGLLVGGVVVCFVIGIIKFIRG